MLKNIKSEQGSALVVALMLITSMVIITSSFLMAHAARMRVAQRDLNRMQAFYAAEAGVYKTVARLSENQTVNFSQTPRNESIHLFGDTNATISLSPHGGFLKIKSTVKFRNQTEEVCALVGQTMPPSFSSAITVGGVQHALVLVGDTSIKGDVVVGHGGVKAGSLKGVGFTGDKLVHGKIEQVSPLQMPRFDDSILRQAIAILQKKQTQALQDFFQEDEMQIFANTSDSLEFYLAGETDLPALLDSVSKKSTVFLFSDTNISLRGAGKIQMPIEVCATGAISINGALSFDDAIVYSPESITVSGKSGGSLQLFTQNEIIIKENANLTYPSLLYCSTHTTENKIQGSVTLKGSAHVVGAIALAGFDSTARKIRNVSRVTIEKGTALTGILYSGYETAHLGKVAGSIVTNRFILYEAPTSFHNWLKDAKVDRSKLNRRFIIPLKFGDKIKPEVVRWL